MNQAFRRGGRRGRKLLPALSLAAAALFATTAEATTYAVTFDTRSIDGKAGSIDFQWNLGVLDPSLTAIVSNFSGPAFPEPATLLFGQVAGTLAPGGRLSFAATDPFNYLYQTLTFGSTLSFRLTLPDTAPATPNAIPSNFVVSLFDSALVPALPSTSSEGAALLFAIAPGGRPALTQFAAATVAQVPEPQTLVLTMMGLLAMLIASRRAPSD